MTGGNKKKEFKEPPVWKPYHWADKIIHKEKSRTVILQNNSLSIWNQKVEENWNKVKEGTDNYWMGVEYKNAYIPLTGDSIDPDTDP